MDYHFYTLDVFTAERFAGNGLAVVLDADGLTGKQMQSVAREFNLSETVFVEKPQQAGSTARVRIFTPGKELPFAGHPTVGTAVLLASNRTEPCNDVRLEEQLGLVDVHVDDIADDCGYAQFTSPALPEAARPGPAVAEVAAALGLLPQDIGFDGHQTRLVKAGNEFLFVPVASLDAVQRCMMNSARREELLGAAGMVGAYVYCRGGVAAGASFHARMFGSPASGIFEDPATGSAAAAFPGQVIASETLGDDTHHWHIEQGFEMGRASDIFLEADTSGGALTAVRVGGHAVIVSRGTINI